MDSCDYNNAHKELRDIAENYKLVKFKIINRFEEWVKKYHEIVKSKDDIEDIYIRLFDNRESNEVSVVIYDIFEGCYINIRKEFALE